MQDIQLESAPKEIVSPNDLLTNRQAAKYLNCSTVGLWRIRKAGQIQPVLVGKKILFRRSELDRYMGKDADKFYTRKDLQERFNISAHVILAWDSEGKLRSCFFDGQVQYRLGDLYKILNESKREAINE